MNKLFSRKSNTRSPASSLNGQLWREVPKINLLAVERRRSYGRLLPRAALAVAVLAVGYGALLLTQQQSQAQDAIRTRSLDQLNLQRQLTERSRTIEELQTQVAAATQQLEASQQSFQLIADSRVNWFDAMTALFNAQVEGIRITSISTPDPLVIEASGTATNSNAIARFRAQIGASVPLLQLLGMTVEQDVQGELTFSAQARIGR